MRMSFFGAVAAWSVVFFLGEALARLTADLSAGLGAEEIPLLETRLGLSVFWDSWSD